MEDPTYLWECLAPHQLRKHICHSHIRTEIFFSLSGPAGSWKAGRLYLGTWGEAVSAVSACPPDCPVTLLLAADSTAGPAGGPGSPCPAEEDAPLDLPEINWILTDLSLPELQDLCAEIGSARREWAGLLAEKMGEDSGPLAILTAFSRHTGSHLFLLNGEYQVICGCPEVFFEDSAAKMLLEGFQLPPETRREWGLPELSGSQDQYRGKLFQAYWYLQRLPGAGPSGAAWLWLSASHPLDGPGLLRLLAPSLAAVLRRTEGTSACSRFLQQLLKPLIPDMPALRQLERSLPYPLEGYFSCIVIRFSPQRTLPYAYFQYRLEALFPRMNHGVYQGDVVLLHTQPRRPADRLDFSYPQFQALLEEFSATAAVSNPTRRRKHLRTMYQMACDTLQLAPALKQLRDPSRIFPQEDYTTYEVIDLCVRQFIQLHRHGDIVYLIHPAIIQLCRYDQQHHSNLRDVMFYYLISDRSLNKTAKKMYMHRNTVLNKVNKILEIIQIPLDDGFLQHRLILSCLILQYYEKVMGRTLQL